MPSNSSNLLLSQFLKSSSLLPILLLSLPLLYILLSFSSPLSSPTFKSSSPSFSTSTSSSHLLFGISSSSLTFSHRINYIHAWFLPSITRALVFLDSTPPSPHNPQIPPLRISADPSQPSAVRIAHIIKNLFNEFDGKVPYGDVRWIVLGDDDTVFFLPNLVRTLGKYDWEEWYYVGGVSESAEQNAKHFFEMAFGGGGFAISYPLAKALARVLDSCVGRYGRLFGSDDRVFACLAELGVGLTRERGFHQVFGTAF